MLTKILRHFIPTSPKESLVVRTKKRDYCQRDEVLEKKARALVQPYAPALAARLSVSWNPRLKTTAGMARYYSCEVFLHPALQTISETEVERTLRHELAHLLAHDRADKKRIAHHGKEWRQACIDLGIPNEKATHQLPFIRRKQQRKFFYRCPSCQEILSRVRQPQCDIACLSCCRKYARGRFDTRFCYERIDE